MFVSKDSIVTATMRISRHKHGLLHPFLYPVGNQANFLGRGFRNNKTLLKQLLVLQLSYPSI